MSYFGKGYFFEGQTCLHLQILTVLTLSGVPMHCSVSSAEILWHILFRAIILLLDISTKENALEKKNSKEVGFQLFPK